MDTLTELPCQARTINTNVAINKIKDMIDENDKKSRKDKHTEDKCLSNPLTCMQRIHAPFQLHHNNHKLVPNMWPMLVVLVRPRLTLTPKSSGFKSIRQS